MLRSILAIFLCVVPVSAGAVIIGGANYNDAAFADFASGTPSGTAHFAKETLPSTGLTAIDLPADLAILQAAVTGHDLNQWISLRDSGAVLTLGFSDLNDIAAAAAINYVPEPSSISLAGFAIAGLVALRRRKHV